MDALKDFEYEHNNSVTLKTSIGQIELTYKTRAGQMRDDPFTNMLYGDVPYEEQARNEPSFFEAVLLENGAVCMIAYQITPEEAVMDIFRIDAERRMRKEFHLTHYDRS